MRRLGTREEANLGEVSMEPLPHLLFEMVLHYIAGLKLKKDVPTPAPLILGLKAFVKCLSISLIFETGPATTPGLLHERWNWS